MTDEPKIELDKTDGFSTHAISMLYYTTKDYWDFIVLQKVKSQTFNKANLSNKKLWRRMGIHL
ncbi:MAG: hypothetical protein ACOC5T_05120 [Elusimicrobiota bacterium]